MSKAPFITACIISGLLSLASSGGALAARVGTIKAAKGVVKLDGMPIKPGTLMTKPGKIETSEDGAARVELASGTTLSLTSGTQLQVAEKGRDGVQECSLLSGTARWTIPKSSGDGKTVKFRMRTQTAQMGVRGTDFLAVFNPVLSETEVIVFEGKVEFQSASDESDKKLVPAGHWGGIGGRFGQTTSELIKLPEHMVLNFDQSTTVSD